MFDSLRPNRQSTPVSLDRLTRTYCDALGMTQEELGKYHGRGNYGTRGIHLQRWALWAIARELTYASLPQLARMFGYADHTTVMHGIRRLKSILATDAEKAKDYGELLEHCRAELKAAA